MKPRRPIPAAAAALLLAACAIGVGDIRINDGRDVECTGQTAPALHLEGRLTDEPDAERVQLTYAVVVDGQEGNFPGLAPLAIPVSTEDLAMVDYRDDRTRTTLCAKVAFDTFTQDGARSFVVRMLRERDRESLAAGQFSIMMAP